MSLRGWRRGPAPERIRHPLPATTWPSAKEARDAALFSSIRIGPIELRHRTWVPAMVPWRATEEGFVTREVLDWYERFARGQPGAIVVEATGIRDIPSGPLLRIGHDRFVPGLRELVETVRVASEGQSRLFIQVIDFLSVKRRPPAEKFFQRFLEIRPGHREKLSEVLEDPRWKAVSTWRVHHIGIISTISLNRADDVDGSRSSALSSSPWRTQLETDVRD